MSWKIYRQKAALLQVWALFVLQNCSMRSWVECVQSHMNVLGRTVGVLLHYTRHLQSTPCVELPTVAGPWDLCTIGACLKLRCTKHTVIV
jgi:hypothetical protein